MQTQKYEGDWAMDVHNSLAEKNITQVGYVPDGGMKNIINACDNNPKMHTIALSSEEEGPSLAAGAWLGGAKTCLIMQSTGVGNCINTFSMSEVGQFPLLVLVSLRSSWGEANRWQVPMGQRCMDYFKMAGFHTHIVEHGEDAGETVAAAADQAFHTMNGVGVFFSQRVMGTKKFA